MTYALTPGVRNELTAKLLHRLRATRNPNQRWDGEAFYQRVNRFLDTTVVSSALEEAYVDQPRHLYEAYLHWCQHVLRP